MYLEISALVEKVRDIEAKVEDLRLRAKIRGQRQKKLGLESKSKDLRS